MKVMLILKRKAGMTAKEFQDYYESSHVVLAHKYLGHLFLIIAATTPCRWKTSRATTPIPV